MKTPGKAGKQDGKGGEGRVCERERGEGGRKREREREEEEEERDKIV